MEISSTENTVSEVFGWAIPGYVLVSLLITPIVACYRGLDTFWAALIAVSGIPVGYVWVYVIYHPRIWKRSNAASDWAKFLKQVGTSLVKEIDTKKLTSTGKQNLKFLDESAAVDRESPLFSVTDRLSSQLREIYPFLAFFHVRHHTLRNIGYMLAFAPAVALAEIIVLHLLGLVAIDFPRYVVLLVAVVGSFLLSKLCLKAADDSYFTTKKTYGLGFAQNTVDLKGRLEKILNAPYFQESLKTDKAEKPSQRYGAMRLVQAFILAFSFLAISGWFGEWSLIVSLVRSFSDSLQAGVPRSFPRIVGLPPLNMLDPSFWYGITWRVHFEIGDIPLIGITLGIFAAFVLIFWELLKIKIRQAPT